MSLPKIYSVKEVAEFLGVSEAIIQKELNDGRLEGFTVGNFWKVREDALLEYIDAPQKKAPSVVINPVEMREKMMTPEPKPVLVQPRLEIQPPMIVTRHPGLVEWLKARGITGPVKDRVTYNEIRGRIVFGELPFSLLTACKILYKVELMNARMNELDHELSPLEMDRLGARIVRYTITRLASSPEEAKAEITAIQNGAR